MNRKAMVGAMAGLLFSAIGCSAEEHNTAKVETEPSKILVAYYSYSGNTRFAAETIQKATGGTLFEIKPVKAYPADYNACVDQAKKEIAAGFKPELAGDMPDLKKYDVVFVGTPNWWSTMAPPVASFLAKNDLSGKTVIPFVTHGGGGMARCENDIRKVCPKSLFGKGGAFSGGSIRNATDKLSEWVKSVITVKTADPKKTLSVKQDKIVRAAAFAAKGDQTNLKTALAAGLDAGVTVNEYKEILTQVYAYCGFPRSLNALGTFMTLVKERGGKDVQGAFPGPLPTGKSVDFGTANQTKLTGRPVKGELFEFAPAIDEFLKAHLFGDIFGRDNLDWQTRELATVAMLAAMPGVEPQLNAHINIARHNGATEAQIAEILAVVSDEVCGGANTSAFPFGEPNTAYAKYFSGRSWLARLTQNKSLNVPVANVTFEPGCRNNWHKHTGGQMLIVTGGVGYYQERGKTARKLVEGDVVEIPSDTEHWHGAAPDRWFAHLSVECNPASNKNTWLEPVSDADYLAATK